VALRRTDGTVYVGWRLLAEDPADIVFDVRRTTPAGKDTKLATVDDVTNFVDCDVSAGDALTYWVVARSPGGEAVKSKTVTVDMRQEPRDYLSVPLEPGVRGLMQPSVADLDGNGSLDYVIKIPDSYIDPGGGNWHYSTRTYKIHAYTLDGMLLWKNDLGPAIELGTWYSPVLVYDFDGDGRAEVVLKTGPTINDPMFQPVRDGEKGRVVDDRECLSIWDGATGEVVTQAPWPSRDRYTKYSLVSRNLLGLAYLDGKDPAIIVARGTYGLIKIDAYRYRDRRLQRLWRWVSTQESAKGYHGDGTRNGSGSHFMHAADVDQDGRDEVIYGSFVLDDDGTGLWALRRVDRGRESPGGHADAHYVGDILPRHDGLEIFYAFEKWHERNGACLVDARTGKMIWGTDAKTGHFHKAGLCADINATHAGMECYGRDDELSTKDNSHVWLWAADGTVIQKGNEADWGRQPETVYWDADLQRELILDNTIVNYPNDGFAMRMEGCARTILVADVLGDWREEVIRSTPGNELRIYTTTIPATDRRPTLLQDPIYRIDVANNGMGYGQTPMVTRCLERH
jgi:rhamnogalacturonan endolyase